MKQIKVLVFPNATNPYQTLLYDEIKKINNTQVTYLPKTDKDSTYIELILLPFHLIYYRLIGYKIFHLHWLYPFDFKNKYLSTFLCLVYLYYIKMLGYKLVYTIHDLFPHDTIFANNLFVMKRMFKISNVKIALTQYTIDELKNLALDIKNINVIPHGNYIQIYKNTFNKNYARRKLGLSEKEFIFLFLGRIELYKGVVKLINTFLDLKLKNTKLVIAGNCKDQNLKRKLVKYKSNNIILKLSHIPDNDIQIYFNAANIAVFPFLKISNSGSILLAASFGKAVIAPRIGSLKNLPDSIGYFYDNEKITLKKAMEKAMSNKSQLALKNKEALKYAKSLSWVEIATKTLELYQQLFS